MTSRQAELDRLFSIYTRIRFADQQTGMVECYTCPTVMHCKSMQCGHFMRRGHWKLRWDRDNARPQCPVCNEQKNGMPEVFEEELRLELGDQLVDELIGMKSDPGHDERWIEREIASLKLTLKDYPQALQW